MSHGEDITPSDSEGRPEDGAVHQAGLDRVLIELERHRLRAHRAARARYLASKHAYLRHNRLGVPVVVLTATVGTAIFASATSKPALIFVIGTGLVSLLAAVLAALQTFFGYAERAAKYRAAAASYATLKRDLDILKTRIILTTPEPSDALDQLEALVGAISELEQEAPDVPDRFYDRARAEEKANDEGV